ncbi:MAG TPA: hypothetical protein PK530_00720 [Anaerolineales bacterium]|nr:hypothetical protein [Anaerolineales bacterium]
MFEPILPEKEMLQPDAAVQTVDSDVEILFSFPLDTPKAILPRKATPLARPKVRVIYLPLPEVEKASRLSGWLHEFVGWGVFIALLGAFLSFQIYLNRIFNSPWSQILTIFTVLLEISLLWRWDQYWY